IPRGLTLILCPAAADDASVAATAPIHGSRAGTTSPIEPGTMVGRYRIVERIGAGGMGEVFLGVDDSLNRRAAVKLLGTKHLSNATVRERFVREARALAQLSHPNLITVFESGHVGDG